MENTNAPVTKIAGAESELKGGLGLLHDLQEEADLCRNETADDIAVLLDKAADEILRLREIFRVNILRLAPETSHAEIDRVLNGEPHH